MGGFGGPWCVKWTGTKIYEHGGPQNIPIADVQPLHIGNRWTERAALLRALHQLDSLKGVVKNFCPMLYQFWCTLKSG